MVAHDKTNDKADDKAKESDKKTSDVAADEAQRALDEQSKKGLRGSGEMELRKSGSVRSHGGTREFGKVEVTEGETSDSAKLNVKSDQALSLRAADLVDDTTLKADASDGRAVIRKTAHDLGEELDLGNPDGKLVLKALEGKTKDQLKDIRKAYKEETGRDLETDIRKAQKYQKEHDEGESAGQLGKALDLLKGTEAADRPAGKQGDRAEIKKTVKGLADEFDLVIVDGDFVLKSLQGKNKEQLREISKTYKEETGRDLEADIRKVRDYQKRNHEDDSAQKLGKALDLLEGSKKADAPRKPQEAPEKPKEAPPKRSDANEPDGKDSKDSSRLTMEDRSVEKGDKHDARPVTMEDRSVEKGDKHDARPVTMEDRSIEGTSDRAGYQAKPVDVEAMKKAADDLYIASRGDEVFGVNDQGWGTDEPAIFKTLEGKSPDELKAMDALYKEKYGTSIEDMLKDELSGAELTRAQDLLHGVKLTDHADGSQTKVYPDKSRVEVDADHHVTEVIAGNGEKRSYQYQGDDLSQVKGQLGTWTRSVVDENGNSTWTSDSGKVWKGEFSVNSDGHLHFDARDGKDWIFTRDGRDIAADSEEGRRIKPPAIDIEIGPAKVEKVGSIDIEVGPAKIEKVGTMDLEVGPIEVVPAGDKGFIPQGRGQQTLDVGHGEQDLDLTDPGFVPPEKPDLTPDGLSELDLTVLRDADGRPTTINYPNGRPSRTIDYDNEGNPTRVASKDSEWRKEGDQWTEYDEEGKKRNSARSVEVDTNGDIKVTSKEGTETVVYADGNGGWMLRNSAGRIDDISYPDGKSREIAYDRAGEPRLIKEEDGSEWRKSGDKWVHRDKQGKEVGRADSIEISEEGEITTRSGNDTFTLARDGTEYGIARDDADRPTKIAYENGRHPTEIEYDAAGNPTKFRGGDSEWRKEGDKWAQYDSAGVKTNTAESIEVTKDGDLKVRYQGGAEVTVYRDGESSMVMTDSSGRPNQIWSKDGSTYEVAYDNAGQPISMKLSDGSEWKKEGAGWKRHGENGADLGSADSIAISKTGEITIRSGNDVYKMNPEGRHFGMQKDEHDRVTSVSYENGRPGRNFEYDNAGNLSKASSDGFEWRKEGKKWVEYDADGKKHDTAKSVEVAADGSLTVRKETGDEFIIYPNGQDSWLLRDKAGRPTDISYPDGKSNEVSYDRSGNVVSIRSSDGSEWKKEGDAWICRNDKGEQIWKAQKIEVNDRGEIVMTGRGHDDVTLGRDGKNYGLFRDDNNRPFLVVYPEGRGNQLMDYDAKGNLTGVRSADRFEWRGRA